jgi:hypothetical protein
MTGVLSSARESSAEDEVGGGAAELLQDHRRDPGAERRDGDHRGAARKHSVGVIILQTCASGDDLGRFGKLQRELPQIAFKFVQLWQKLPNAAKRETSIGQSATACLYICLP